MTQYIDKAALVAEIERLIEIANNNYAKFFGNRSAWAQQRGVCEKLLSFIDTLEEKEEPISKEYWLFTINYDNVILNCFLDFFPSKKDLKKASNGKEYAIIHTMQLTKEQFNKLTKDE
jgi:hypothetical protein